MFARRRPKQVRQLLLLVALGLATPAHAQTSARAEFEALQLCWSASGREALAGNMSVDRLTRLVAARCAKQRAAFVAADVAERRWPLLHKSEPEPPSRAQLAFEAFVARYRDALFAK